MPHPIKRAAIPIARPAARKERAFPIPPFPAGAAALSDPSKSCSQRSLFSFSVGAASASGRLQAHPKEIAQISRARKGKEANSFSARLTKAAKYRRISIKQFVFMMECCAVCSARHPKRRFFVRNKSTISNVSIYIQTGGFMMCPCGSLLHCRSQ